MVAAASGRLLGLLYREEVKRPFELPDPFPLAPHTVPPAIPRDPSRLLY